MWLIFSDSEVAAVQLGPQQLRVVFAAAHVERLGAGHSRPEPGYTRLVLEARLSGPARVHGDCFGRLRSGRIVTRTQPPVPAPLRLPLPCRMEGALVLELVFADGAFCGVEACELVIEVPPEAFFLESRMC